MPSVRKTLVVSTAAVALGWFFALLAVLHGPAFAQGRVCADDVAQVLPGRQRWAREADAVPQRTSV